jgi:transcriptional regulator with XRE-family HTH domain
MKKNNNNISEKIKNISSERKSIWRKETKYNIDNEKWLDYSTKIAMRIMAIIDDKKELDQITLAGMLDISLQRINKILQGKDNLTLKTIGKLSDAIEFELITFPPYKDTYTKYYEPNIDWDNISTIEKIKSELHLNASNYKIGESSTNYLTIGTYKSK